jgi:hypothetical protein
MNMYLRKRKGLFSIIVVVFICAVLGISGCESALSESDSIPLTGPLSIQITPGNEELVVQWTKVAPAKNVIPTYELYWSTTDTPGTDYIVVGTNDSKLIQATITELENNTPYYVWVKAVFEGIGKSDFSPPSIGIPIPVPKNVESESITVYSGYQMLELRWDTVEDASNYEVYYSTSNGLEPPTGADMRDVSAAPGSEQGVVLHGLTNGTSYTVWIRAANSAGKSPDYSTITGTPSTGSLPSAPVNIEAGGGDTKITVIWAQVHGVKKYKLYYSTTNNFSSPPPNECPTADSTAPKNTAEITGLSNGTTYYVWVVSSNGAGDDSGPSTSASASTVAKPPIDFNNSRFELGNSTAVFPFAQDLPVSAFFPDGRPSTDRLTRVQETALGNLFADGAAWYFREKLEKHVDFVFINGGYIDNNILKGKITVGSLMGTVGSGSSATIEDKLVIVKMKGSDLKKFFYDPERELSLAAWNEGGDVAGVVHMGRGGGGTGFFGVVSKEARYTLEYPQAPPTGTALTDDQKEPYYHGRIKPGTLKINGVDIEDSAEYRIGTSDYLASGAYFTTLSTGRISIELIDVLFWRGVAEYIYDKGTISPYLDGRIKIEGGVPLPAPWVNSSWKPSWLP